MENTKISVQDLNLHYGTNHALKHVNMEIRENAITAFIGPSGCGKSTFLKCLNRMNDLVENVKIEGKVLMVTDMSSMAMARKKKKEAMLEIS